jgi:hypothetical protein
MVPNPSSPFVGLATRVVAIAVTSGIVAGGFSGVVTGVVMNRDRAKPPHSSDGEPLSAGPPTTANASPTPNAHATADTHARLAVRSAPAGATVTLDGKTVGATPIGMLEIEPGLHALSFASAGYVDHQASVSLASGDHIVFDVVMTALPTVVPTHGALGSSARLRSSASDEPGQNPFACAATRDHCRFRCDETTRDCSTSCGGCNACTNTEGWDHCRERCATCRQGCEQNGRFCESACEDQYTACDHSS